MALYNVLLDYDWTSVPRGSNLREKAPKVYIQSHKIKSNMVLNRLKSYFNIIGAGDGNTFYDKLYEEATVQEDDFNFPYFSDKIRSFSNTFGDTFGDAQSIGGELDAIALKGANLGGQIAGVIGTELVGNAAGILTGGGDIKQKMNNLYELGKKGIKPDPGAYIETPKLFQYDSTSDSGIDVSFMLSNTINEDSIEMNYDLIRKLTIINRPMRNNSVSVDPPRIYSIRIPGQRYIRWAYCNSFSIDLVGNKREINNVIVPEGYQVNMSFQSLTMEHAGFMDLV